MDSAKNNSKETVFKSFPAPVEQVKRYNLEHSRQVELKGRFLTRAMVALLLLLFRSLSLKWAYRIGKVLGELLYLFKIRKQVVMTNLDIAFGDSKSVAEKNEIYRKCVINVGRYVTNFFSLPYKDSDFWQNKCRITNKQALNNAYNKGKGVIIIGGHLGMWDIAAGVLGMQGYPISIVAKRVSNPVIDRAVVENRNAMNLGTIAHVNSMPVILESLSHQIGVIMAMDQNMKKSQGVFVKWLGRLASTVRSSAYVVRQTGVPVIAGYMLQHGPEDYEIVISEEIDWVKVPDDPEEELRVNTRKHLEFIEESILANPEIWFWLHRRWKRQPDGVPSPYKK